MNKLISNNILIPSLDEMFKIAGIEKESLHKALREMGPDYLVVSKEDWTPGKPTTGYCYMVSEAIYYNIAPEGARPARLANPDGVSHWFLVYPGEIVIDLTSDQCEIPFEYKKAEYRSFSSNEISKRAKILANKLFNKI